MREAKDNQKTVLVVLKDAHTRMTIRTTLERAGFALNCIEDTDEALAACRKFRPAALIVGSRLSKMDGFVFMYKLTGDGLAKLIPTIMIAEESERGRERMALSRGAKAFLIKPLKVRGLLEKVLQLTKGDARKLDERHREQVEKLETAADAAKIVASQSAKVPKQVPRKMIKRVEQRRPTATSKPRGQREELIQKLREEVRRLKGIPYHKRLELDLDPKPENVDKAFQRLAMKYHPDRYKHHGKDARRLAQGVFMLLRDAKKALKPVAATERGGLRESEPPRATDSWEQMPARHEERREPSGKNWTPQMLNPEALEASPNPDRTSDDVVSDRAVSDSAVSDSAVSDSAVSEDAISQEEVSGDEVALDSDGGMESGNHLKASARESGERAAPDDPTVKRRAAALAALAEGRYRDAKNQIGRLLDNLEEDETDVELILSDKLARGHLRWEEGLTDDALELFEAALVVEPGCPEALTAIAELKEALDKPRGGLLDRFLGKK